MSKFVDSVLQGLVGKKPPKPRLRKPPPLPEPEQVKHLKRILIIGPSLPLSEEMRKEFEKEDCLIIGDGKRVVLFNEIEAKIRASGGIGASTIITIVGHGLAENGRRHRINIGGEELIDTRKLFEKLVDLAPPIRSDKPDAKIPMKIHAFACYVGAAAKDVDVLPEGSVLVAHGPEDEVTLIRHNNAAITNLARVGNGKVLHDLMINAAHEMHNVTVAMRLNNGKTSSVTLRPPRHDIRNFNEVARYIVEQWEPEIKSHIEAIDRKMLPESVNLKDIPDAFSVGELVLTRSEDIEKENLFRAMYFAKTDRDYEELEKFIRSSKKDLNEYIYDDNSNLLHLFGWFKKKKPKLIEVLIKAGVDPKHKNAYGETLLDLKFSNTEAVKNLVLSAGVDKSRDSQLQKIRDLIESTKVEGRSPFEIPGVMDAIYKAGADETGKTPLHFAESSEAFSELIKMGADPNAKDKDGKTPLELAARRDLNISLGHGVKIPVIKWASDQNFKIEGKEPIAWAIESSIRIEKRAPMIWAAENNFKIAGDDPIEWAAKNGKKIDSYDPYRWKEIYEDDKKPLNKAILKIAEVIGRVDPELTQDDKDKINSYLSEATKTQTSEEDKLLAKHINGILRDLGTRDESRTDYKKLRHAVESLNQRVIKVFRTTDKEKAKTKLVSLMREALERRNKGVRIDSNSKYFDLHKAVQVIDYKTRVR